MKKIIKEFFILIFVLICGFNIIINIYMKGLINNFNKEIKYICVYSFIPDNLNFVGFKYKNLNIKLLSINFSLTNLINKQYNRIFEKLDIYGIKYVILKKNNSKNTNIKNKPFVFPFFKRINIKYGKIEYIDKNTKLYINEITGKSKYFARGQKNKEYMLLNCSGLLQNKEKIYLKFYFFPYYKNKFSLEIFGREIKIKIFENLFKDKNIKIDEGTLDFLIQVKSEFRKIYVNNIMHFKDVKIKEKNFDFMSLFGLSTKQILDFLHDSNGDFYINFKFSIPDKEINRIFYYYADEFKNNLKNRILLGVITAPVRQIKDLIWNLTGENVIRIFKIFSNE